MSNRAESALSERQLRVSLHTLLAALGDTVRCFAPPAEFTKFYRAEFPGCLLLDVRMPGQTGLLRWRLCAVAALPRGVNANGEYP